MTAFAAYSRGATLTRAFLRIGFLHHDGRPAAALRSMAVREPRPRPT
jgi:hypothetical protein